MDDRNLFWVLFKGGVVIIDWISQNVFRKKGKRNFFWRTDEWSIGYPMAREELGLEKVVLTELIAKNRTCFKIC